MMAIEPDTGSNNNVCSIRNKPSVDGAPQVRQQLPNSGRGTNNDFVAIAPDVEEAAHLGDPPGAAEA